MARAPNFVDHAGKPFEDLTAEKYDETSRKWRCRCICGKVVYVFPSNLVRHNTRSCGCLRGRFNRRVLKKHGMTGTPTYKTWVNIKTRCQNEDNPAFDKYGAKGVTLCRRWQCFENFLADMGERPGPGYSIERRKNAKGYTPSNCRWIPKGEQARNKTTNHRITVNGETKLLADWARILGCPHTTLLTRLRNGWSEEATVTTPIRAHKPYAQTFQA
jgi:hypothetical protein